MSGGHSSGQGGSHGKKENDTLASEVLEEIASEVGSTPKGDMSVEEGLQRYDALTRPDSTAQRKLIRKAKEIVGRESDAFKVAKKQLEKVYRGKSSKVVVKDKDAIDKVVDAYMDKALDAAYLGLSAELDKEVKAMEKTKGGRLTKEEIFELKMGLFDTLMGVGKYRDAPSIRGLRDGLYNSRKEEALAALEQASGAYEQQLARNVLMTLGSKYINDDMGSRSKLAGIVRKELDGSQYEASSPLISRSAPELLQLHTGLRYGSIAPDKLGQYGLRGKKDVESDSGHGHKKVA